MESQKDCEATSMKLPIYLSDLLHTEEDIIVVHCKRKVELDISSNISTNISTNTSELNLTGRPLEVDLNVLPPAYDESNKKWNQEERTHIPVKLQLARKYIADYHKLGLVQPNAVYCICDGSDEGHTVVLGSRLSNGIFVRTLVFAQDCVDEDYPENNMDSMMNEHIKIVGVGLPKIETNVMCCYELYGHKLKNENILKNMEENVGSVLLEGSWNSHEYNIPRYGSTIKMVLQVIVGHKDSIMQPFFNELSFLNHCLKLVSNRQGLDDKTVSFNPLNLSEVYKRITDILCEVNIIKKPTIAPNNVYDAVENIKETSFTDKLWSVMKYCETVDDVRSCLGHLFETINDEPMKVKLFQDDNNTMIGKIMNDIYAKRMIVPCLSSKQSLELLIELGIHKMKKIYFSIIKSCDFTIGEQLLDKWNKIGSSLCETRRETFTELNLSQGLTKLHFLLCAHVVLEFLQLVEQKCSFSKDVSLPVLRHAFSKYINENSSNSTLAISETKQLCDLVVPLTYPDIKLIQDYSPVKWQIKMTSTQKNSSVETMFHYCKTPIFPDTIYKYEEPNVSTSDTLQERFFVTRLETYSDKIC